MKDINSVVVVGRLTRDAELKYTPNGTAVLNLSVAVNRSVKRNDAWEDEVSFFDAVLFGKLAEGLAQYCKKGQQIGVQGSLRQERWENKDGAQRSRVKMIADTVRLLGGKRDATESEPDGEADLPAVDDFDDSLPF